MRQRVPTALTVGPAERCERTRGTTLDDAELCPASAFFLALVPSSPRPPSPRRRCFLLLASTGWAGEASATEACMGVEPACAIKIVILSPDLISQISQKLGIIRSNPR